MNWAPINPEVKIPREEFLPFILLPCALEAQKPLNIERAAFEQF
jgi:hypothetical protein